MIYYNALVTGVFNIYPLKKPVNNPGGPLFHGSHFSVPEPGVSEKPLLSLNKAGYESLIFDGGGTLGGCWLISHD